MSAKCQKQTFSHPQKETPCSRFPNRTGLIRAGKYAQPYQSALVPWIVQAVETFATARLEETVPPFIAQTTTLPLVSRQRMSLLPSPSKSPVSTIDQAVGTVPTDTPEATVPLLFNSHIATLPLLSRQRMSVLPSPFKSPTPTIDQLVGTFPSDTAEETVPPFICQSATSPVLARQIMPLPVLPAIDQLVGTVPTSTLEEIVPPFISHIATLPLVSRQRMSALPSPLKSRWPTIDQVVGTVATDTPEETAPPFISQ